MIIFYKQWRFWLTIVSVGVVLFNLSGYDDMNILLFFTSLPMWVTEWHVFAEHLVHPGDIPIAILYTSTIIFWFFFGWLVDIAIAKWRRN